MTPAAKAIGKVDLMAKIVAMADLPENHGTSPNFQNGGGNGGPFNQGGQR